MNSCSSRPAPAQLRRARSNPRAATIACLRGHLLAGLLLISTLSIAGCLDTAPSTNSTPSGATVFAENCAVCHTLPILSSLFEQNRGRPPGFVYDALTRGNMRRVGRELDDASRRAVAEFFTGVRFDSKAGERDFEVSPRCTPERNRFDWSDRAQLDWGHGPRNPRAIPADDGLTREEARRLAVQWVVAFPETSQLRSHPTAAGGALFVGSHNGSVYALDQASGCTRWHFKAATEVRSAVTLAFETSDTHTSPANAPNVRAIFGDRAANVYALDAETGELLWTRSVDPHLNAVITGSLSAVDGMLFVPVSSNDDINALDPDYPCCTHHGAVVALDVRSGEILWRTPTIPETPRVSGQTSIGTPVWGPSGASVWNTPSVSTKLGLVFVGTGNNHSRPASAMSDSVLALEMRTGRVVWSYQSQAQDAWNAACLYGTGLSCPEPEGPDTDFGATTLLLEIDGRDVLFAGQKSGLLHALDPATGELLFKKHILGGGAEAGIRYGMATYEQTLYVPNIGPGNEPLRADGEAAGLFALSADDGSILWSTPVSELCVVSTSCSGALAAPPLAMAELVFAAGLEGVVHAIDRHSGEVVWSFDTARDFETLLGKTTRGGGIAGMAGPMVAGGRLFVSSGYGQAQLPGNALIAFAPE